MFDNVEKYIPLEQCEHGHIYAVLMRNGHCGIYNENVKGFLFIRTKWGSKYPFYENHWDTGAPHGTAKPIKDFGKCDYDPPDRLSDVDQYSLFIATKDFLKESEQIWEDAYNSLYE